MPKGNLAHKGNKIDSELERKTKKIKSKERKFP